MGTWLIAWTDFIGTGDNPGFVGNITSQLSTTA